MTIFPLNTVPPTNLVQILGKMGYREATRMRRTCHDINQFLHNNKHRLKIPVERVTFQFEWFEIRATKELIWQNRFEMNFLEHPLMCQYAPFYGIPESALFDSITVVSLDGSDITTVNGKPLLEYVEKSQIRCHELNVMKKLAHRIDIVDLYKACKASTVFVGNSKYHLDPEPDEDIPLQLDIVKELANLKCPTLVIELCEELPYEYVEILSQFQVVNIGAIENDWSPSLAPLLKLMISDHVFPLKSFLLPVYSDYLSPEETRELQMEKWRLKQGRHVLLASCFFINSPNYYILLWEHVEAYTEHCCGHRIPKSDIDLLVSKWISHYHHLPIDGSSLYEYILNNQDNYDGIKEQMEKLLDKTYSTTTLPDVETHYLC